MKRDKILSVFEVERTIRMNSRNNLVAWSFLVLSFSCATRAQTYTVTDLGVLQGDSSSLAYDVNSVGQVTGCSDNSTSQGKLCQSLLPSHAYLWSSGTMQDLSTLPGDDSSVGYYVSDSGKVVGFSENSQTGAGHGFLWTPKTQKMIDLGALPGGNGFSIADAITSKDVIVGAAGLSNGDVDAVLWTLNGGKYHIHNEGHFPQATNTSPYFINEQLKVVGVAYFHHAFTKYRGFLWSKTAGWMNLGTLPGGKNSFADCINNPGTIVGMATSAKFPNGVAVYWNTSGIHKIGTLPGGTSSFAGFINDLGEVVGESVSGTDSHAFIWDRKAGLRDLNNLIPSNSGWVLNHASSVNGVGQISGFGTINGANHGFLLTPSI
jgi:probable HAF family extracellular repeat protein